MCLHDGALSYWASFDDLMIKTRWEVETKLVLTSHLVVIIRSSKLAQYEGAPSCGHIRANDITCIRPTLLGQCLRVEPHATIMRTRTMGTRYNNAEV